MHVERAVVAQDVERGTRQLVRHRFQRDHAVRLLAFALVPGTDRRAAPDREVRRFDEGAAQVPVAALGVAAAFGRQKPGSE